MAVLSMGLLRSEPKGGSWASTVAEADQTNQADNTQLVWLLSWLLSQNGSVINCLPDAVNLRHSTCTLLDLQLPHWAKFVADTLELPPTLA